MPLSGGYAEQEFPLFQRQMEWRNFHSSVVFVLAEMVRFPPWLCISSCICDTIPNNSIAIHVHFPDGVAPHVYVYSSSEQWLKILNPNYTQCEGHENFTAFKEQFTEHKR
jgi:hypothetical protein